MTSQGKTLSLFLKQQCQFPVQIQCSFLYIDQALPLNSFFKTSIYISCIRWSKVCMILASPLDHFFISLFLVICFKLPTTQTFFYFPRRFEWLGVNCSYIVFIAILFTDDRQKTKGHKSQTRMQWIYTAKQSILVEYSQLLPCRHPDILGILIRQTTATSQAKTNYRHLSEINSCYYGLSLMRTLLWRPYSVCFKRSWLYSICYRSKVDSLSLCMSLALIIHELGLEDKGSWESTYRFRLKNFNLDNFDL